MEREERWKTYMMNPVSHSVAHHLMAIVKLRDESGYARVTDVAQRLGLSRGSVSLTLKGLESRGLVGKAERRFLRVTQDGQAIVNELRAKRRIVERFFADVLGVAVDVAETDACKVEHLLSPETATAMLRHLCEWTAARGEPDGATGRCVGELQHCPSCGQRCLVEGSTDE